MMDIWENLKMAFTAIMANKLRSSLTMLGIAIGNGAVVALVGVGKGAQVVTAQQFESLGPNVLFVSISRPVRATLTKYRPLVLQDAQAIAAQIPAVAAVSPEIHLRHVVSYQKQNFDSLLLGVTPDYLLVRNFQLAKGRFINSVDLSRREHVIVLGAQLAEQLFGRQNPIGQRVRVRNLSFEVIGVLSPKGSLFGTNQDERALIPLTTMASELRGRISVYGEELT